MRPLAEQIADLRTFYPDAPFLQWNGHTFPVLAYPAQASQTLDDLFDPTVPDTFIDPADFAFYDHATINRIRGHSGGRLFNGFTFVFDGLTADPLRVRGKLGRYFDHLATCVALEHELITGEEPALRRRLHKRLPADAMTQTGRGRGGALGGGMLVIYRGDDDGYHALFTRRSMQTATRPGAYQVVPAFVIQPEDPAHPAPDWSLSRHFLREYVEELFGAPELESDASDRPEHHPAWDHLQGMLRDGSAELLPTGWMFNLLTTHVGACALLLLHDPAWLAYFRQHSTQNWETTHQFTFPVDTEAALNAALPPDFIEQVTPQAATALALGLPRARHRIAMYNNAE